MPMPHAPMEKELLQHLERVQQRLARLRKDEDRLLTLLNRQQQQQQQRPTTKQQQQQQEQQQQLLQQEGQEDVAAGSDNDDDELWLLLEEIQLRSQAIRSTVAVTTTKDGKPEELEQEHQGMSHKKRVSFQQQQQQQQLEKQQKEEEEEAAAAGIAEGGSKKKKKTTVSVVSAASAGSAALLLPSPPAALVEPSRYQPPTRDQVAAILRLTNPVELQRHLLRALLDNQVDIDCYIMADLDTGQQTPRNSFFFLLSLKEKKSHVIFFVFSLFFSLFKTI